MTRLLIAVACVVALSVSLHAQLGFRSGAVSVNGMEAQRGSYQQLVASTTAIGLVPATTQNMSACSFTIEAAPVRFRIDQPPTATTGTPMVAGDTVVLTNITDARAVKFIRSGTVDGLVNANCWPQ